MGRDLHFRPGSFYRKDDRTGFPVRAEDTRKEWNGLITWERVWEPRQPQDLVRGVKDKQSVPEARPLPPNDYVGPIAVQMSDNAAAGQTFVEVESTAGFGDGDMITIMLNDGSAFTVQIEGTPSGGVIAFATPLPYGASSGNLVNCLSHAFDAAPFTFIAEDVP